MLPIWKNLGFILYVVLYFTQTDSVWKWPEPNLLSVVFKVLPIFHVILIIVSSMSDSSANKSLAATSYQLTVAAGLALSSLGDAALVYKDDMFLIGLGFFAAAQALYIKAFGFRPLGGGPTAVTFGILAAAFYAYLYDGMRNEDLVVRMGTVVYAVLIFTMAWRGAIRFIHSPSLPRLLGAVGALSFVASDFMLAFERWRGSFTRAPMWVMITYYSAQLLIGLSACDDQDFEAEEIEAESSASKSRAKVVNGTTSAAAKKVQ